MYRRTAKGKCEITCTTCGKKLVYKTLKDCLAVMYSVAGQEGYEWLEHSDVMDTTGPTHTCKSCARKSIDFVANALKPHGHNGHTVYSYEYQRLTSRKEYSVFFEEERNLVKEAFAKRFFATNEEFISWMSEKTWHAPHLSNQEAFSLLTNDLF